MSHVKSQRATEQLVTAGCAVSVVTPSYNSAETIVRAMDSVRAQTVDDWEMIICDDASVDGSADLVREASSSDPRIRLVSSAVRSGPAGARNLALSLARGDCVAFLDADDALEPTYLERMLRGLGPGVGIVCCDALMVDPHGRSLGRRSDTFGTAEGLDLAGLLRRNRICVAAVCPRSVIEEAGGFSCELFGTEDYDLWVRILERGYRVMYVDAALVWYRTAFAPSVSSDRARMAANDRLVFERALARGRLGRRERNVAQARRDLAAAAERWATRTGTPISPLLLALRARARLAAVR